MATIAENLQTIIDIKADIKTAIENKGVDMTNTPFSEYSTKIDEITTGGGSGKIDIAATGIKFGNSTFTEIPDVFDFSNVTNMSNMFYLCASLTTIPLLDTTNVTNMFGMFYNCTKLQSIPELNTSNATSMGYMFFSCVSLTTIPLLDTTKVTDMTRMFYNCTKLQSIPLLECGKVTNMDTIFGYSNIDTFTDLGGFKNLKISVTSNFLDKTPNLTVDSLMNVINNVYDLTANGLSGQSLCFGQTNLDKLTGEQIAVATAKGWTLTA